MRVFLDDQPLSPDPASAGEALRAAASAAERGGRIIVDIIADGKSIAPEEVGGEAGAVTELRLVSADPVSVVREAIGQARELLRDLRPTQTRASDSFLMGEFEEGASRLREVIGVWQQVRAGVEQAGMVLSLPIETVELDAGDGRRPLRNEFEGLSAALTALREALTRQDVAALADLLEYDLGALARRWDRLLGAFLEAGEARRRSWEPS